MPTVTKSIGTGKDYTTITAWEADLDNDTPYDRGDDAVGECFNEEFDEAVTINGGGTLGLNSVTLSVAVAERHNGTAGTGARIVATASRPLKILNDVKSTVEWLEIDQNGQGPAATVQVNPSGNVLHSFRNNIVHDVLNGAAGTDATGIYISLAGSESADILNNIVYDIHKSGTANKNAYGIHVPSAGSGAINIFNNTVHNTQITNSSNTGDCFGIRRVNDADVSIKNNLSTDTQSAGSGTVRDFELPGAAGPSANNCSSDDTADDGGGSGHVINVTTADQYESTTADAENLHLKVGSDAIDAGTDLGTSPPGIELDIDGRDRDAQADTWDIGADEHVAGIARQLPVLGVGP